MWSTENGPTTHFWVPSHQLRTAEVDSQLRTMSEKDLFSCGSCETFVYQRFYYGTCKSDAK